MVDDLRSRLQENEGRINELRKERAAKVKERDAAKEAYDPDADDETSKFDAVKRATSLVRVTDLELAEVQGEQQELLKQLGDAEAGLSGALLPGVNGWATAARELSLAEGRLRVDVPAASLLQAQVPMSAPGGDGSAGVAAATSTPPTSNRFLYPTLPVENFPTPADVVGTDFVITTITDSVTGVAIEPATDDEKASLPIDVSLATPSAKTYAIVAENIPQRIFDSQSALQAFLGREMSRHLSEAVDAAVVGAIEAASPPSASVGADLVAKIRNARASASDLGSVPSVIALTPADAASLDLSQDGAGRMIFAPDRASSGSPVWSVQVRETPSVTHPLLIDPQTLGLIYAGSASVMVDPYTGLKTNQVRIRVETELVAMHIRNIHQGAFSIS
jgi:hypothetical protein